MEEKNNKSVTLRAFSIKCSKLSSNKSDYVEKLKEKLENTVVNDRRMRLSQQDPKKEESLFRLWDNHYEFIFYWKIKGAVIGCACSLLFSKTG